MEENVNKECITESLCCTPETNTTLYINYISVNFFLKELLNRVETSL